MIQLQLSWCATIWKVWHMACWQTLVTLNQYSGFGLFYNTPRPSYSAYAVMTKMLDGAEYWGENVDLEAYAGEEKEGDYSGDLVWASKREMEGLCGNGYWRSGS